MPVLTQIAAALRALRTRIFWRHKWTYKGEDNPVRTCTVCQRVEVETQDGWGTGWDALINGVQSRHYSKGE